MRFITKRPAIIHSGLPGDLLLATPALRAIGTHFGFNIPVVCHKDEEQQRMFSQIGFTNVIGTTFKARPLREGETVATDAEWNFDADSVLAHIRAYQCDSLLNISDSCGPGFRQLAEKLALPDIGLSDWCSYQITDHDALHRVEHYFQFAHAIIDAPLRADDFSLFPHRSDSQHIRKLVLEEVGNQRTIAMHADTKPDKMWPLNHWARWLQMLWRDEPDTRVILLGYPAIDSSHYASDPRLLDCRDLPLTVNLEITGLVDCFVGIDSCMLHAADLCRTPGVGIFTSIYTAQVFGFRFSDSEHLQGSYPPNDISPEAFHAAYQQLCKRCAPPLRKTI